MPRFSVEDRVREAYIEMARQANYRPEAAVGSSAGSDVQDEAASYAKGLSLRNKPPNSTSA